MRMVACKLRAAIRSEMCAARRLLECVAGQPMKRAVCFPACKAAGPGLSDDRDLVHVMIDRETKFPGNTDHLVGPGRRAPDPQDGIALLQQPDRDWVEHLIESVVADSSGTGEADEGK